MHKSVLFGAQGLDPASRRNLWDVVKNAKQNRGIILTTHSMEEAEVQMLVVISLVQTLPPTPPKITHSAPPPPPIPHSMEEAGVRRPFFTYTWSL